MAPCNLNETLHRVLPHKSGAGAVVVALLATACSGSQVETFGSATLTWTAPTRNTDGSPLRDLAGYRIYCGNDPSSLRLTADVSGASSTRFVVIGLAPGIHCCVVRAYNSAGQLSDASNLVSKTI
jgi:hypothetical protein